MRGDKADPVDREVGAKIRAARLRRGQSQAQLAAAIGVSFQQLRKYEAGTNRVSASTLVRLARALETTVASLFPDPEGAQAADLTAHPEGAALVEAFLAMPAPCRSLLVEIARTFARSAPPAATSAGPGGRAAGE